MESERKSGKLERISGKLERINGESERIMRYLERMPREIKQNHAISRNNNKTVLKRIINGRETGKKSVNWKLFATWNDASVVSTLLDETQEPSPLFQKIN
ncbi:hypothetical protein [Bacillus ectoiniformans]|uniref:hypothetical protein n=1 Tax=Bacillus ectoiniformans TaxID=1494429 RepID=UPI0019577429|nr:hypothetical protein [Bacillus ectoiniformans]